MSGISADIGATRGLGSNAVAKNSTNRSAGSSLNMDDFLQLIVAQFQNQDPENAASSSDMLNQLVQMSTIQAITNITDATTMMYTASLVGKTVTVGEWTKDGLKEVVGTVTATGSYNGQPVIFVDGVSYTLDSIMAVGKLPPKEDPDKDPDLDPEHPIVPPETDKDPEHPVVPPETEKPPETGDGDDTPPATGTE